VCEFRGREVMRVRHMRLANGATCGVARKTGQAVRACYIFVDWGDCGTVDQCGFDFGDCGGKDVCLIDY